MSKTKTTQYILMGLAAVSAISVVYYFSKQQSSKPKKKLDDRDNDDYPPDLSDDITVKSKGRSFDASETIKSSKAASDATVTDPSDVQMDEKTLHAKIEELDKKGKAFFKNKQVSLSWSLRLVVSDSRSIGFHAHSRITVGSPNTIIVFCLAPFVLSKMLVSRGGSGIHRGPHAH
jgi:hypothetical protein